MIHKIDEMAFWRAINKWEETAPVELILSIHELKNHMINEYGIKFYSVRGIDKFDIVDEKKYMIFLLKYS
jgi:hypothetical protein